MDDDLSVILRFIALALLIVFSGFFSGSETALFSLSKLQLQKLKDTKTTKSKKILALLASPKHLLISILLGNELVNISITAISASLVIHILADQFQSIDSSWLNILIVVPLLLLFGEVIPKTLAIQNNERFSLFICQWLDSWKRLGTPVVWIIFKLTDLVVFLIVGERSKADQPLMEEEFITLIEDSSEAGVIEDNEKELIYRVFELGNMPVSNIMAPRGSIFSLPNDMPLKEMISKVSQHHRSAIPIYEEFRDRIIGILYARRLLNLTEEEIESGQVKLEDLLAKPTFIPETKLVYDLFREFQFKKNQIALVLDEFGAVIGLVAIGDILEEMFGSLEEHQTYESLYQEQSKNRWTVDASMPLEELTSIINTPLDNDDFETVGGMIFDLFGKLPSTGDTITHQQLRFTVKQMDLTKITQVQIEKLQKSTETEQQSSTK